MTTVKCSFCIHAIRWDKNLSLASLSCFVQPCKTHPATCTSIQRQRKGRSYSLRFPNTASMNIPYSSTLALCPFISMLKSPILLINLSGQLEDTCSVAVWRRLKPGRVVKIWMEGFQLILSPNIMQPFCFMSSDMSSDFYSPFFLQQLSNITVSFFQSLWI